MTPMIDVVFLLLVFFVCASIGHAPELLLPAELESGQTESQLEPMVNEPLEWEAPEVYIHLTTDPDDTVLQIELNDRVLAGFDELRRTLGQLATLDSSAPVVLDIDDSVSAQQFVSVYDLCQSLQFDSLSFAVRKDQ